MEANSATFQRNAKNMLLGKRTNCLLVKDDVGKSKPFTHSLPNDKFSFGKGSMFTESAGAGKSDSESAPHFPCLRYFYFMTVIDNYQYSVDDPKMRARNPDIKDFKKLNKVVLAEGATNAMVSPPMHNFNLINCDRFQRLLY